MQPTEMRPPCANHKQPCASREQIDTYDVVVLAAHGVRAARLRADTDDGEGRALQADLPSDIAEGDTEERQEGRARGGAGLKMRTRQQVGMQQTPKQRSLTLSTLLQHWMGPVLQFWAAARSGSARAMAAIRANILVCVKG